MDFPLGAPPFLGVILKGTCQLEDVPSVAIRVSAHTSARYLQIYRGVPISILISQGLVVQLALAHRGIFTRVKVPAHRLTMSGPWVSVPVYAGVHFRGNIGLVYLHTRAYTGRRTER